MSEVYEVEKEDQKKPPFYYYLWDSFGKPPAERRLLVKLDCSLLIFSVLGLICRYIDQTNINTACRSESRRTFDLS
jgi:ACS family pantothenate transporter-like MFS transporter